jgi:hypothetical protein
MRKVFVFLFFIVTVSSQLHASQVIDKELEEMNWPSEETSGQEISNTKISAHEMLEQNENIYNSNDISAIQDNDNVAEWRGP